MAASHTFGFNVAYPVMWLSLRRSSDELSDGRTILILDRIGQLTPTASLRERARR